MKNKIFPILATIAFFMLPLTAVALRDPNYSQSQQLPEGAGVQIESVAPEAVLEEEFLEPAASTGEESTLEPEEPPVVESSEESSSEPEPTPSPAPSSPPTSEPGVLGASIMREPTEEHLRLSKEISALHASAQKNDATSAQLAQFQNKLGEQNIILVVFALILFFFGVIAEVRYAKISRFMASAGKHIRWKKKHR